jgi:cytochrome c2
MKKLIWCMFIATIAVNAKPTEVGLIATGKELFVSKACFACHQINPKVPNPTGDALKATKFIGKFWGTEREVHIGPGGPIKKVKLNDEYFMESVEKPMAKIVKGAIPAMAPLPTTLEERKALAAFVKSLSK